MTFLNHRKVERNYWTMYTTQKSVFKQKKKKMKK